MLPAFSHVALTSPLFLTPLSFNLPYQTNPGNISPPGERFFFLQPNYSSIFLSKTKKKSSKRPLKGSKPPQPGKEKDEPTKPSSPPKKNISKIEKMKMAQKEKKTRKGRERIAQEREEYLAHQEQKEKQQSSKSFTEDLFSSTKKPKSQPRPKQNPTLVTPPISATNKANQKVNPSAKTDQIQLSESQKRIAGLTGTALLIGGVFALYHLS